jgi:hypothetical protein
MAGREKMDREASGEEPLPEEAPRRTGYLNLTKRVVWTQQAKADIRAIEQPKALQVLEDLGSLRSDRGGKHSSAPGHRAAAISSPRTGLPRIISR